MTFLRQRIMPVARACRDMAPEWLRAGMKRAGDFLGPPARPLPPNDDVPFPGVIPALRALRGRGFHPKTVVDVGAYVGRWTSDVKSVFPEARFLMVEPQAGKRRELEAVCGRFAPSVTLAQVLLGAEDDAEVEFVEMETGSSVFEENSPYERRRVKKRTVMLDTLLAQLGWEGVELLKLDVQGYELEVLRGANGTLPRCEFVLMEASLIPINSGCPTIAEVMACMTRRDFLLYDICSYDIRRKDGALWATDLLFVSKRSSLVPRPELTTDNW